MNFDVLLQSNSDTWFCSGVLELNPLRGDWFSWPKRLIQICLLVHSFYSFWVLWVILLNINSTDSLSCSQPKHHNSTNLKYSCMQQLWGQALYGHLTFLDARFTLWALHSSHGTKSCYTLDLIKQSSNILPVALHSTPLIHLDLLNFTETWNVEGKTVVFGPK